jgi:hypothetical protein
MYSYGKYTVSPSNWNFILPKLLLRLLLADRRAYRPCRSANNETATIASVHFRMSGCMCAGGMQQLCMKTVLRDGRVRPQSMSWPDARTDA